MINEPPKAVRKRRLRPKVLIPVIVIGLILISGALYVISPVPSARYWGEETTRGDFLREFLKYKYDFVPPSPPVNSFHELLIAARWHDDLHRRGALEEERVQLTKGEITEVSQDLRDYVHRNERPFAVLKQAVREPCVMPTIESFGDQLPYLAAFRNLARGLAARAKIREMDGDPAGAYDDYLDVLRLGNCSAHGQVAVIHGMVAVAIHAIGADAMQPGIKDLDENLLQQTIAGIQEVQTGMPSFEDILKSEFNVLEEGVEYFMKSRGNLRYLRSEAWDSPEPNAATNLAWLYVLMNKGRIRGNFQKLKATSLEWADQPISQSRGPLAEMEVAIERSDPINRLLFPALARTGTVWANDRARLRGLLLRAAVELYQRRQGEYPESLQQLVDTGIISAVPDDPFDGKPFRYIPSPDGGKIYSVGPDLVDNKAEIEWYVGIEGGYDAKGDWVF